VARASACALVELLVLGLGLGVGLRLSKPLTLYNKGRLRPKPNAPFVNVQGVLRLSSSLYDPNDLANTFSHLTNHCIQVPPPKPPLLSVSRWSTGPLGASRGLVRGLLC
jgi:hypothetical protein